MEFKEPKSMQETIFDKVSVNEDDEEGKASIDMDFYECEE